LITAAALGQKKTKAAFKLALNNTVQQIVPRKDWEVSFLDSSKDPLLWAADYCAVGDSTENGKAAAETFVLTISSKPKIKSEFDLWSPGAVHYLLKRTRPR